MRVDYYAIVVRLMGVLLAWGSLAQPARAQQPTPADSTRHRAPDRFSTHAALAAPGVCSVGRSGFGPGAGAGAGSARCAGAPAAGGLRAVARQPAVVRAVVGRAHHRAERGHRAAQPALAPGPGRLHPEPQLRRPLRVPGQKRQAHQENRRYPFAPAQTSPTSRPT